MKKHTLVYTLTLATLLLLGLNACSDTERDMQKPAIVTDGIAASPTECDAFLLGDTIHFCYRFTDNAALGNYNVEVHSNHDHHTHSTSAIECELDPPATAEHPWVFNQSYAMPEGQTDYVATADIVVPVDVDPGDYHFMIRITDASGWQEIKSLAIKIVAP